MAKDKYITYFRVSTQRQGVSGLGLEAQREAVRQFLGGDLSQVVNEYTEVESGRKTDVQRPELAKALAKCKKEGAVLLVAKLDRLARNVHFVSGLMQAGVKFKAVDLPEANDLTIHIMAAFAEHEAKRISDRTKAALAATKARGTILGTAGAANLKPNIEQRQKNADASALKMKGPVAGMRARGLTQRAMLNELNTLNVKTVNGGAWSLVQLQRLLKRLDTMDRVGAGTW